MANTVMNEGEPRPGRGIRRWAKAMVTLPGMSALIMLIIIAVGFHIWTDIFLSPRNINLILGIVPELGVVVLGVTLLMIAREFDLSVGSVFSAVPMMIHTLMTSVGIAPWPAIVLGLVFAAMIGFFNGFVTVKLHIPSFVTTLGMFFIARSIAIVLGKGPRLPVPEDMPLEVFVHNFGFVRASLFWYLGLMVILFFVLHRTNWGNWIYATGGHTEAAKDMGIKTDRVKMSCFMLCSVLAGFGGMLQSFRLGGSPLANIGLGIELEAIASTVIGGTVLFGGVGSIFGAVVGTLLIRSIDNGLVMGGVEAEYFRIALGGMIVFAVLLNTYIVRWFVGMRS